MKFECRDLENALGRQEPELLEALNAHADSCPGCRAQLQIWNGIPEAAGTMRRNWDSPNLWSRIRLELERESQVQPARSVSTEPRWRFGRNLFFGWQPIAAALLLAVVSALGMWTLLRRFEPPALDEKRLLTEQALHEIESTEEAYIRSIERLSQVVKTQIQQPTSPLLLSYREKLTLIDAAIAECRSNIDRNRFNAHLRRELLSMYQEKQHTLQELLKEERNEKN